MQIDYSFYICILQSLWFTTISMVYYNLYGLLQSLWFITISMVYYNLNGLLQSLWFTTISMVYCNLYGFPLLLHQSMNQRMTNLIDSIIGDAKTRKVWQLNLLKTRLKLLSSVDSNRIRHGALYYKDMINRFGPTVKHVQNDAMHVLHNSLGCSYTL